MTEHGAQDPGDVTLAGYQAAAHVYARQRGEPGPALVSYLDRFTALVGRGASVLELGSGPGVEASHLEARGVRVRRTDGTPAFVEMMHADGHDAAVLDVRTGDLGGPWDAILADAVLLHLTRPQFADLLVRARAAVVEGGILAVTLKEGDGEQWSTQKLDVLRWFTYWREPAVRIALAAAGWAVLSIEHVQGRVEPWLYALARAA